MSNFADLDTNLLEKIRIEISEKQQDLINDLESADYYPSHYSPGVYKSVEQLINEALAKWEKEKLPEIVKMVISEYSGT